MDYSKNCLKRKDIRIYYPIASGGLSKVLIAKEKSNNQICAVKKMRVKEFGSVSFKLRYQYVKLRVRLNNDYPIPSLLPTLSKAVVLNEIACLKLARHKNVLQYYGTFGKGSFSYIITEYCVFSAEDLLQGTVDIPMLPVPLALYIITPILNALQHIHSKGIIHMDIKPGNIMLTRNGIPKIIDFGLSKISFSDIKTSEVGTFGFIAPEIYREEKINQKVDLFSFGVTMLNFSLIMVTDLTESEIKDYMITKIPEKAKQFDISHDIVLCGSYTFPSDKNPGEFGEYLALSESFMTYKPDNRCTIGEALQTSVIQKYNTAWESKNDLFNDCFKLLQSKAAELNLDFSAKIDTNRNKRRLFTKARKIDKPHENVSNVNEENV